MESDPNIIDFFEILEPVEYGIIGIMAILYARRFNWKVEVFSKSYLALGLGYLVVVPGMVAYYFDEFCPTRISFCYYGRNIIHNV